MTPALTRYFYNSCNHPATAKTTGMISRIIGWSIDCPVYVHAFVKEAPATSRVARLRAGLARQRHAPLLLALMVAGFLTGCVHNHDGSRVESTGQCVTCDLFGEDPVTETKFIKTPLALIQATRDCAVWTVTVTCRYERGSVYAYNIRSDSDGTLAVKILTLGPARKVIHELVPVNGGAVTLVYAPVGYKKAELRLLVVDEQNAVVHTETLR